MRKILIILGLSVLINAAAYAESGKDKLLDLKNFVEMANSFAFGCAMDMKALKRTDTKDCMRYYKVLPLLPKEDMMKYAQMHDNASLSKEQRIIMNDVLKGMKDLTDKGSEIANYRKVLKLTQ